jgi:hypothetical protein
MENPTNPTTTADIEAAHASIPDGVITQPPWSSDTNPSWMWSCGCGSNCRNFFGIERAAKNDYLRHSEDCDYVPPATGPEPVDVRALMATLRETHTVREIATHLGVAPRSVCRWSAGDCTPYPSTLTLLVSMADAR